MPKQPAKNHTAIVTAFEDDVLTGKFPCGTLFRLAIERQRRDLANPPAGYHFDPEKGDKACRFADLLPCSEGPTRGKKMNWQPWQYFIWRTLHGWVDGTGAPRFRYVHVFLPKGNGKSPFAAATALHILCTGTGSEKCYSAASAQKQARLVFSHCQEMLRLAPKLAQKFGLNVGEHAIKGIGDSRVFEPVSSEAGSLEGIRPSLCVVDELHTLPDRKLYDNIKSAVSKTFDGRLLTITTAGNDCTPANLAYGIYNRAKDIVERKATDESTFCLIAEADRKLPNGEDADPFSIETLKQANPNLEVSVSLAGLLSAAQTAKDVPSERPSFEIKHCGWWQQGGGNFIDLERWNACGVPGLTLDQFKGSPIYIGIDLAATRDLTARVLVAVKQREDGQREYFLTTHAYLPENSITLKQTEALKGWAGQWLTLTEGEVMNYNVLRSDIEADCEAFPGSEVCFDPWSAQPLANDLEAAGITAVAIRQGAQTQSSAMKELESAVLSGRLKHDASPLMGWCIGNLLARADRNGNIAPDRANEYKKIDLAVAAINALVRAQLGDTSGSPYSADHGYTFIDFED